MTRREPKPSLLDPDAFSAAGTEIPQTIISDIWLLRSLRREAIQLRQAAREKNREAHRVRALIDGQLRRFGLSARDVDAFVAREAEYANDL